MEQDIKEESIEQITKILEQHLKNSETMFEKFGTLAIEYADIKRILKILIRNKELEEENRIQRSQLMSAFDRGVIHKSLVEEKIEEYTKLLKNCNRFSDVDRIKAINERILAYKELLEKRK